MKEDEEILCKETARLMEYIIQYLGMTYLAAARIPKYDLELIVCDFILKNRDEILETRKSDRLLGEHSYFDFYDEARNKCLCGEVVCYRDTHEGKKVGLIVGWNRQDTSYLEVFEFIGFGGEPSMRSVRIGNLYDPRNCFGFKDDEDKINHLLACFARESFRFGSDCGERVSRSQRNSNAIFEII